MDVCMYIYRHVLPPLQFSSLSHVCGCSDVGFFPVSPPYPFGLYFWLTPIAAYVHTLLWHQHSIVFPRSIHDAVLPPP